MREFKVVVVGNGGVGKSALTVQFVQGLFVSNYDATIEDSYRKNINVDGEECRLEILDTAGTEQFSGMRDLYVKNGQGFVIVYAVNDQSSFREVMAIRELIVRIKQRENVPIVIVGNKTDLRQQRVILQQQGKELARQFGCAFYETSAKLNENVNEIFLDVVRQINRLRLSMAPPPKKRTLRMQRKKSEYRQKSCCSVM